MWAITNGCMHEELPRFKDACADLLFADPPYGEGVKMPYSRGASPRGGAYTMIQEDWDNPELNDIGAINERIVTEAWRVLKPGGILAVTCSNTNVPWFFNRLGTSAKTKINPKDPTEVRFKFLNANIWLKTNAVPYMQAKQLGRCAPSYEYVLIYAKGMRKTFHYEWMRDHKTPLERALQADPEETTQLRDVWCIPQDTLSYTPWIRDENGKAIRHPAQKAKKVLERVIVAYTNPGDLIIDPCCGSGASGAVSITHGRSYWGIERDPKWARIAEEHLIHSCPTVRHATENHHAIDLSMIAPIMTATYQQVAQIGGVS